MPFNPVFFSYAVITHQAVTLYVDSTQLPETVKSYLGTSVVVRSYETLLSDLHALGSKLQVTPTSGKVLLSNKASLAIQLAIGTDKTEIGRSVVVDAKSIKNEVEKKGFRDCHIRDGAALVRYFAWLEEELLNGKSLNEAQGADKLEEFRK